MLTDDFTVVCQHFFVTLCKFDTVTIMKADFLKLRCSEDIPYFYAERKGIDSVAFILIDESRSDKYGVIHERKPAMDDRFSCEFYLTTAFGGSNDSVEIDMYENFSEIKKIDHFKQLVKHECKEESGYSVKTDNIFFTSKDYASTQMNQWVYLFYVNVTHVKFEGRVLQDVLEEKSSVVWKDLAGIRKLNDWKCKSIIFNMI